MKGRDSTPEFDPGSSVLVSTSPTHSAVDEPLFEILSDTKPTSVVGVTYERSADEFLRRWRNRVGTVPEFARVITVGRSARSTATQSSSQNVVRPVSHSGDLAGIQTEITSALNDAPTGTVLLFDSLTTLLEHVSLSETASFMNWVSSLLAETGAVGYFHLNPSVHDITTIVTLDALTDETVERDDDSWVLRSSHSGTADADSYDVLFDVLRSRRRREVIRYLLFTTESAPLEELVTVVAESELAEKGMNETERRRFCISLDQIHLPKLDDMGFIEYDSTTRLVSICEKARKAESFLALTRE